MSTGKDEVRRPPLPILNRENFTIFDKLLREQLPSFEEPGLAIATHVPFVLRKPTLSDSFIDSTGFDYGIPAYPQDPALPAVLDSSGHITSPAVAAIYPPNSINNFRLDLASYDASVLRIKRLNVLLQTYIFSSLSFEVKTALLNTPGFDALYQASDNFAMYDVLIKLFKVGSARTVWRLISKFFASTMGSGSHEAFVETITTGQATLLGAFGFEGPFDESMRAHLIDVRPLIACIYLAGVDQALFAHLLEQVIVDNPSGRVLNIVDLFASFQVFYLSKLAAQAPIPGTSLSVAFPAAGVLSSSSPSSASFSSSSTPLVAFCSWCLANKPSPSNQFRHLVANCHSRLIADAKAKGLPIPVFGRSRPRPSGLLASADSPEVTAAHGLIAATSLPSVDSDMADYYDRCAPCGFLACAQLSPPPLVATSLPSPLPSAVECIIPPFLSIVSLSPARIVCHVRMPALRTRVSLYGLPIISVWTRLRSGITSSMLHTFPVAAYNRRRCYSHISFASLLPSRPVLQRPFLRVSSPCLSDTSPIHPSIVSSPLSCPSSISSTTSCNAVVSIPPTSIPITSPVSSSCFICADSHIGMAAPPSSLASQAPAMYYDTGATYTTVCSLSQLMDPIVIDPIAIGGISSGVLLTHRGTVSWLPAPLNVAYYAQGSHVILCSLGALNRMGATYSADASCVLTLQYQGVTLDTVPMLSNNLYPILRHSPSPTAAFAGGHLSAEQRRRCDLAESLHCALDHPSDDVLCEAVTNGSLAGSTYVTASDIRLNRTWRGLCVHCCAGKHRQKSMPSSTSQPAVAVGEVLCVDVTALEHPTKLNAAKLQVVDEFSGAFFLLPIRSSSSLDIFTGLVHIIRKTFNASGHKTLSIHADCASVFKALEDRMGALGIRVTESPPNQHQQRAERYTGTHQRRTASTLHALPFVLPDNLLVYLEVWIAQSMLLTPNSRSRPSTPFELIFNKRYVHHPVHPFLPFGTVCMVSEYPDKRAREKALGSTPSVSYGYKAELGVLVGRDLNIPGSYNFLTANGSVLPRNVISVVQVNPFNFVPRAVIKSLIPSQLPIPEHANVIVQTLLPPEDGLDFGVSGLPEIVSAPAVPSRRSKHASLRVHFEPSSDPGVSPSLSSPDATLPLVSQVPIPDIFPPSLPLSPPVVDDIPSSVASSPLFPTAAVLPPPAAVVPPLPIVASPPAVVLRRSERIRVRNVPGSSGSNLAVVLTPKSSENALLSAVIAETRLHGSGAAFVSQLLPSDALCFAKVCENRALGFISNLFPSHNDDETIISPLFLSAPSDACAYAASPSVFSQLRPVASPKGKREVPFHVAIRPGYGVPLDVVRAGIAAEMTKLLETYPTMRLISDSDIASDAIRLRGHMLCKYKANGAFRCRLAIGGNAMPADAVGETYSPCIGHEEKMLVIASMQAFASQHDLDLTISDCDISSAFLQVALKPIHCPRQIVMRIPSHLPHPLAGRNVVIISGMYGLPQSNKMFDDDFRATVAPAGFLSAASEPCVYIKQSKSSPFSKCIACMTVDDGLILTTSPKSSIAPLLSSDFISVLEARYGPLSQHATCTDYTGLQISRTPTGGISLCQRDYILRIASEVGVSHLPIVATVSNADLFACGDSTPVDVSYYRKLIGLLIHCLKTRHDARKEIIYLSSHVNAPTVHHRDAALHVFRYLLSTAELGPIFQANAGPNHFCCFVDAANGAHLDGSGQSGMTLHVGGSANAAFATKSMAQADIALEPFTSEYYALSEVCKLIVRYRQLLTDIGFTPIGPTTVFEDNQSAVDLANAPHITKRAKHINIRYHFTRQLVQTKIVSMQYVASVHMTADLLTKYLGPKLFAIQRARLFNLPTLDPDGWRLVLSKSRSKILP